MTSAIERLAGKSNKLSDVKTREAFFKINEEFDFIDLSDGEYHQIRLLPGVFAHAKHWPEITITKDGKSRTVPIPKPCHNLDMRTGGFDSERKDPIYDNREHFTHKGKAGETGFGVHFYMCVIDREAQEKEPRKPEPPTKEEAKSGFKKKGSKSWTPVRVLRIPKGCVEKIVKLAARNIEKGKKGKTAYDLSDIDHGRDIIISFDADAAPANKWDVQLADDPMSALTKAERKYLIYDIETAIKTDLEQESPEETKKWVKEYIKKQNAEDDDDDDDDDEDERPSKKAKKKVGKKSRKDDDDDDLDDLDLDLDDDDDEDEKPKKKKGKKDKKSKSKDKKKSKKSKK